MNKKSYLIGLTTLCAGWLQAADFVVGDLSYNILPSGTEVEVTERVDNPLFGTTDYPAEVTVPETVTYRDKTYNVVAIGDKAFYFSDTVEKITLPESITSIGEQAFADANLLITVNIPASVTSIGERAFSTCPKLKSLVIPESITELPEYLLYSCRGLKQLTLPSNLKAIRYAALRYCRALTNVVIPESVTTIEDYAFGQCSALESIELPTGLETIGESAFTACEALESISFPASVTSFGNNICYGCTHLESVSLPEGITAIPNYMFYQCEALKTVEIPSTVRTIGKYAFEYAGLTSLTIPTSVTTIEIQALDGLKSLKTLIFEEGPSLLTVGKGYLGKSMFADSPDVASLTYGRNLAYEVTPLSTFTKVKDLTIGKDVTSLDAFKPGKNENIRTIRCNAITPPTTEPFYEDVYENATLIVPSAAKDVYMSKSPWNSFVNVEADMEESGIKEIETDSNAKVEWFDMTGRRIDTPSAGIYIRVSGEKKEKIYIR